MACHRIDLPASRREFLLSSGLRYGATALAALTGERVLAAPTTAGSTAARKIPHRLGQAKNIIFLFMEGGPSQVDTFDPKPKLNKLHKTESKRPAAWPPVTSSTWVAPMVRGKSASRD